MGMINERRLMLGDMSQSVFDKMTCGSLTFDEPLTDDLVVNHNLGSLANGFVLYDNNFKDTTDAYSFEIPNALVRLFFCESIHGFYRVSYKAAVSVVTDGKGDYVCSNNAFLSNSYKNNINSIRLPYSTISQYIIPGRTYNWIAWA